MLEIDDQRRRGAGMVHCSTTAVRGGGRELSEEASRAIWLKRVDLQEASRRRRKGSIWAVARRAAISVALALHALTLERAVV
jgi:hypothetical protein